MLQIENVSFTYPGQSLPSLKRLSLTITKGTFTAVVGSNGSGKSTMCKLFNGIIPHFFVGDMEGKVWVDGVNTLESDVGTLSAKVGYVYQDFENSIVRSTVFDEVSFAALNYGYDDYRQRAEKALEILQLDHLRDEYIWQLSGGQKHLVALAGVVSVNPDYIIVDEPVAQLDPFHARQTYDMLRMLHEQYGKTILVIEHHTEFIAEYCQQVVLLKDGAVQWTKPTQEALSSVEDLVKCNIFPPQVTQIVHRLYEKYGFGKPEGMKGDWPITVEQSRSFLEDFIAPETPTRPHIFYREPETDEILPTVSIEGVEATYRDYHKRQKVILQAIDLRFYAGERIAVVGNNGAGKSTLMRLISRLMKPTSGKVEVMERDTLRQSPEEVAETVAYIYQNPEEMFIDDTIERDVSYFLRSRNIPSYQVKVGQILEILNLTELKNRDARLLSGGQQRRVSLAIGMGMKPKVILLDEPTASLDIASRKELLHLLHVLQDHIQTAVVATHDMQLVADWATRVIVMHRGKIIADTTPQGLFMSQETMKIANLLPPQVVELSRSLGVYPPCLSVDEMTQGLAYPLKPPKECTG